MPDPDPQMTCVQGVDQTWTMSIKINQLLFTGYTTANTLTAILSLGSTDSAISPGLTTNNAAIATGKFDLTAPGTSTTGLVPGPYSVLVKAAVGSGFRVVFQGELTILPAPGSLITLPTYCTKSDMATIYPTIDSFLDLVNDLGGFLRQRNLAYSNFNHGLIERYNPQPGMNRRRGSTYDSTTGWDVQDLVTVPPSPALLRSSLAAAGLILTAPDNQIVAEINARLAIAYVLDRNDGGDRRQNPYAQDAVEMRAKAAEMMAQYRAFVDTDADGIANVLIDRDVIFLT